MGMLNRIADNLTGVDESWRAAVGVNRIAINLKPASEIVSAAGVGTTFYYDLWGKAGAMLASRCGSLGSLQPTTTWWRPFWEEIF